MQLRRAPGEVRRRLDRTEHVVTWTDTAAGPLVVTNLGLWWPGEDGAARRIGWENIDKAVWSDGTLSVVEADIVDDLLLVEREPVALELTEPRSVPSAVRKRVESTVAQRHEVPVTGQMVRIVARRLPGRDGLGWWALLPDDLADTEPVREAIRRRIERLRGPVDETL